MLREEFLIESVFENDKVKLIYTGYDRFIVGGIVPKTDAIKLVPIEPMKPADIYKSLGICKATYCRYLLMEKVS